MTFPALRLTTICLAMLTVFLGFNGARAENAQAPDERVMLVLDASGSMWGKIGEEHKITIARKVIGDLLQGWEPNRHLGLMAYGHRQRGDCSDIEVLSPVGPADIGTLTSAINDLNPKGKTPITAAVQAAAEALRYTEERATVILVSDGLETCKADPCAAARALEAAGIDLTVHVVGFDLGDKDSASLQCVADETGGQFVLAGNAEQLEEALKEVARAPEPSVQYFEARVEKSSPPINDDLIWTITQTQTGEVILRGDSTAQLQVTLPAGAYLVEVIRTTDESFASKNFKARDGADVRHTLLLPIPLPSATLQAPDAIGAGSPVEIAWTGPDDDRDFITIVQESAKERTYKAYAYTASGSPLEVRAPDTPGDYEIRYLAGQGNKTLVSRKLLVEEVEGILTAEDTVTAGSPVEVEWIGPNNESDFITIVPAGTKEGKYKAYTYTRDGSPLEVRAPDTAGNYEIRYLTGQSQRTLVARKLIVADADATLAAVDSIGAGSQVQIEWTGPNNQSDFITIVPTGTKEGKYKVYTYTRDGSPLEIRAPDTAGDYEIRYLTGQSRKTLVARKLTVTDAAATLAAVDNTGAGSQVEIAWTGPNNQNDFITIVAKGTKEGRYKTYTYTRDGSPLEVRAPDTAGEYEIRYLTGQSRKTLVARKLVVTDSKATLAAVDSVGAGTPVEIEWTGPNNQNDFITIVSKGTKEGKYKVYTYTREGSPLEVRAPDTPGDYEIRYLTGQSRKTIVARNLVVVETPASVKAVDSIGAGSPVEIEWTGPNNQNDFITIVQAKTKEGKYKKYVYTRKGSPIELPAPDEPGDYEIRYLTGQTKRTLANQALSVTEVTATLWTAQEARPEQILKVLWTGPDNDRDFITIVPADAKAGKYKKYVYTRKGSPAEIPAPSEPGSYEIRYLTGQSKRTLVALPLEVKAAQ